MRFINHLILLFTILLYLVSLSLFIVASEFVLLNLVVLCLAITLNIISVFIYKRQVVEFLISRLFKNLIREFVTLLLVMGIIGIINFLVFKNNYTVDTTKHKIHSLSEQTQKVIENLKGEPLSFTLYAKRSDWERYLKLLNMYRRVNSAIEIRVIDVDTEPALVAMNKISENGTLIIDYKKQEYRTILKDELALTNMLMKITKPQEIKLYFSTGHNEAALDDESPEGMSYLASTLTNSNFKMSLHDLKREIPKDASAFLMIKPQLSFAPEEISNIERYLSRGGSLIVTLAPRFDQIELQNFSAFLSNKGIQYINGIVLDRLSASQGGQASVPMVNEYSEKNPITKSFQGRTLFPVSSFFKVLKGSNYEWDKMVSSLNFPATWGESDFSEVKSGKASYDEKKDYKGPLAIGLVGKSSVDNSKIILFGSSSFISNQFQGQANNFNLFLNSVSWATDEKSILSLDRPELKGNLIYISEMHFSMVFYFAILFFPFIFFGLGIYFYRKKLSR